LGYTHYYYIKEGTIPSEIWERICHDFRLGLSYFFELPLNSKGKLVALNSQDKLDEERDGHINIHNGLLDLNVIITPDVIQVNGVGEGRHETFVLSRLNYREEWQSGDSNMLFNFCKTARKPYDLFVCSCLIIAKNHLKNDIKVTSDGEQHDWAEAIIHCQNSVGYGSRFKLDE